MSATSPISTPATQRSFDENVASIVRVLMATRGMDGKQLAAAVGMTKSTMYLRLQGKPWLAAELDRIAGFFGVSARVFFESVESMSQNWKEMTGPDLRVLTGGGQDTGRPRPSLSIVR